MSILGTSIVNVDVHWNTKDLAQLFKDKSSALSNKDPNSLWQPLFWRKESGTERPFGTTPSQIARGRAVDALENAQKARVQINSGKGTSKWRSISLHEWKSRTNTTLDVCKYVREMTIGTSMVTVGDQCRGPVSHSSQYWIKSCVIHVAWEGKIQAKPDYVWPEAWSNVSKSSQNRKTTFGNWEAETRQCW